jgi:hypothetical protein
VYTVRLYAARGCEQCERFLLALLFFQRDVDRHEDDDYGCTSQITIMQQSPATSATTTPVVTKTTKTTANLSAYRRMREEVLGDGGGDDDDDENHRLPREARSLPREEQQRPLATQISFAPTPEHSRRYFRRDDASGEVLVYEGPVPPGSASGGTSTSTSTSTGTGASSDGPPPALSRVALEVAMAPPPPEPFRSPPPGVGRLVDEDCWSCDACTFINRNGVALACEMCGTAREDSKSDEPGTDSHTVARDAEAAAAISSAHSSKNISRSSSGSSSSSSSSNSSGGGLAFQGTAARRRGAAPTRALSALSLAAILRRRTKKRPEKLHPESHKAREKGKKATKGGATKNVTKPGDAEWSSIDNDLSYFNLSSENDPTVANRNEAAAKNCGGSGKKFLPFGSLRRRGRNRHGKVSPEKTGQNILLGEKQQQPPPQKSSPGKAMMSEEEEQEEEEGEESWSSCGDMAALRPSLPSPRLAS